MTSNTCKICGNAEMAEYIFDHYVCTDCKSLIAEKEGADKGSLLVRFLSLSENARFGVAFFFSVFALIIASIIVFKVRGIACSPSGGILCGVALVGSYFTGTFFVFVILEKRYLRFFLFKAIGVCVAAAVALEWFIYLLPKKDLDAVYSSTVKYASGRAVMSGGGEAVYLFGFEYLQVMCALFFVAAVYLQIKKITYRLP